jgi:hypothetical protein
MQRVSLSAQGSVPAASQLLSAASVLLPGTEREESGGRLVSAGQSLQSRHTWRQPQLTRPKV